MIYRYKYLSFTIVCLLALIFIIWRISRPSTLEVANEKLAQSKSYGEIKWAWQEYENELAGKEEWMAAIDQKLARINLTNEQKLDLRKWYVPSAETDPNFISNTVNTDTKQRADSIQRSSPEDPMALLNEANKGLSPEELADLYNRQGDEKCKAFKAADSPHFIPHCQRILSVCSGLNQDKSERMRIIITLILLSCTISFAQLPGKRSGELWAVWEEAGKKLEAGQFDQAITLYRAYLNLASISVSNKHRLLKNYTMKARNCRDPKILQKLSISIKGTGAMKA